MLWRSAAGEAMALVRRNRTNPQVAAQREALMVWNPLADEVLSLWLCALDAQGSLLAPIPADWMGRATAVLEQYRTLAESHRLCGRHRQSRGSFALLLRCLEHIVASGTLDPRQAGWLRVAVTDMVRRRGTPGSPEHQALRAEQARQAAQPTTAELANVLAARLAGVPQDRGIEQIAPILAEVDRDEAARFGVPAGSGLPASLQRQVLRCCTGTLDQLLDREVISSPQVMAELLDPQRWGNLVHPTEAARSFVAAFPAAAIPAALVGRFHHLSMGAGLDLPWVRPVPRPGLSPMDATERHSSTDQYPAAAQYAALLLAGSLYERFFGLDYAAVVAMGEPGTEVVRRRFWTMCTELAGCDCAPAALEQAKILTTDNLCLLVDPLGAVPPGGWLTAANRCFDVACQPPRRAARAGGGAAGGAGTVPSPPASLAWRRTVFFLSLAGARHWDGFIASARQRLSSQQVPSQGLSGLRPLPADQLGPAVESLAKVMAMVIGHGN